MAIATVTNWDDLPVLLTIRHIIDVMGVSRDTAYNLVHRRGFPAMHIGKQIRVPRDEFKRWVETQATLDETE